MDDNKFINDYINVDRERNFDINMFTKREKLKTYIKYLDLIEYDNFRKFIYAVNKLPFVWKGYFNGKIIINTINRYITTMISEGFIEEVCYDEENINFLVNNCNLTRHNATKTILYTITEKGRSFLKLDDISNYMRVYLDKGFKKTISKELKEIFENE